MSFEFFAPCPRGLESALAAELAEIGARLNAHALQVGAPVPGGVHFRGDWHAGMAANLHSRIASRILLKIAHRPYRSEHDIYALAREQCWEQWFSASETLRVDITAIRAPLKSLEFTTLRVKDAICDRLRDLSGARPGIDTATPDVRVFAFLSASDCTLYLDTSGEPLFKRGWRLDKGAAPLRENLAAGILRLTGWTPGTPLYDPMCGSGTFLAEAAQIALDIAPGIERHFGFEKLKPCDTATWRALKNAALDARHAARHTKRNHDASGLLIFGSDISGDMLEKARANFARAGLQTGDVPLRQVDARGMTLPVSTPASMPAMSAPATPGIVVANPPYGERIEVRGRNARGETLPARRALRDDAHANGHHDERHGNRYDSHYGSRKEHAPPVGKPRSKNRDRNEHGAHGDDGSRDNHDRHGSHDERSFRRTQPDVPPDSEFFHAFGDALKQRFTGWRAFVLTSDRKLPGQMRLRESAKTPLYNGALECRLFRFDLIAGSIKRRANAVTENAHASSNDVCNGDNRDN